MLFSSDMGIGFSNRSVVLCVFNLLFSKQIYFNAMRTFWDVF